ncbi:MAG: 2,3-bisphosphoglycerate-dependent phosphoglycerate mutase [Acidimicrobiaceae bacterium]|nr:2,3-bisphosphoglycerate-dependent phosphoglycerate mutase [Acidimicrobiaceae bacterium]
MLLRHGRSEWNDRNLFTGWVDSDLSAAGIDEARRAGELMLEAGIDPDVVHTSVLVRAIRTAWIAQDAMGTTWLPVRRSWRLNERHYGALQGLDKKATADRHGADQVHVWRRSYDVRPPDIERGSEFDVSNDRRYRDLPPGVVPLAECLKDTLERVLPYWEDDIVPDLRAGRVVLVAAHGNSLRALVKHLDRISDDEIMDLNIPTGTPLVYELDDDLSPTLSRYLGPATAS